MSYLLLYFSVTHMGAKIIIYFYITIMLNGKIKKMGWDQVEEIAAILENIYNIKVQRLLQRNSTKQQKKLHRQERLSTIGTSYSLKQEVYDVPQKVVVLDDIITTGATLESCAKVLKEAGVKEVYGISLYSVD